MAWILVFHVLGLVFWMGSLLIVTNLMAFQAQETAVEMVTTLQRVERRLLRFLALPGALLVVATGSALVSLNFAYYAHAPWFHGKLFLVVVLLGLHWRINSRVKAVETEKALLQRSESLVLHAGTALLFIGILILVLVKPL